MFTFICYRFSVISSIESPNGMAAGLHTSLQNPYFLMLPYFFSLIPFQNKSQSILTNRTISF